MDKFTPVDVHKAYSLLQNELERLIKQRDDLDKRIADYEAGIRVLSLSDEGFFQDLIGLMIKYSGRR